jgi:hypothetical protein
VADEDRLGGQLVDDAGVVLGDLVDAVASEGLRVGPGEFDRFLVAGPAWRDGCVACLLEQLNPGVQDVACSQSPWMNTTGVRVLVMSGTPYRCGYPVMVARARRPGLQSADCADG